MWENRRILKDKRYIYTYLLTYVKMNTHWMEGYLSRGLVDPKSPITFLIQWMDYIEFSLLKKLSSPFYNALSYESHKHKNTELILK